MKLVALTRAPVRPDEAAKALADAMQLALAEARMRLAPEPPALLARLEPDRAKALVAALRKAGLAALAIDAHVPTDDDRLVARSFSFDEGSVTFTSVAGDTTQLRWTDLVAILRGVTASRTDVERTEKKTRLSATTAVLTGGLMLTRTTKQTVRLATEAIEHVILVYARDGRSVKLAEGALAFSCLGERMQPSSTGNMVELSRLLRERARGAYYDERLLRLGRRPLPFLAGGESRIQTATTMTRHTDTSESLDVLAEVMRQAIAEGLLP